MAAPVNDNFANATVLSGDSGSTAFTTVDATLETGEPDNAISPYSTGDLLGQTVWFTYTPTEDGALHLSVTGDSDTADTTLEIFTGSTLTGLTLVGSDDDGGVSAQSQLGIPVTAGTTYRIRVDSWTYQGPVIAGLVTWDSHPLGHTTIIIGGVRYGIITVPTATLKLSGGADASTTAFESYDDDASWIQFQAGATGAYYEAFGLLPAVASFFHTDPAHSRVALMPGLPATVHAFARVRTPTFGAFSIGTFLSNVSQSHVFRNTNMNNASPATNDWFHREDTANLAVAAHFFDDLAAGDVQWYMTDNTTTTYWDMTCLGVIYDLPEDLVVGGWQVGSVAW